MKKLLTKDNFLILKITLLWGALTGLFFGIVGLPSLTETSEIIIMSIIMLMNISSFIFMILTRKEADEGLYWLSTFGMTPGVNLIFALAIAIVLFLKLIFFINNKIVQKLS